MPSLRDSRNTIATCNVCAYGITHKRIVWDKQTGFTKVSK
jgi:hypothetical protein